MELINDNSPNKCVDSKDQFLIVLIDYFSFLFYNMVQSTFSSFAYKR